VTRPKISCFTVVFAGQVHTHTAILGERLLRQSVDTCCCKPKVLLGMNLIERMKLIVIEKKNEFKLEDPA
jgi:hypothetical protein